MILMRITEKTFFFLEKKNINAKKNNHAKPKQICLCNKDMKSVKIL